MKLPRVAIWMLCSPLTAASASGMRGGDVDEHPENGGGGGGGGGGTDDDRRLQVSALSDEFDDQSTFDALWSDQVPGLVSSASVSDGTLTLTPTTSLTFGWYGNDEGILLSQSVASGQNFVAEARLSVSAASGGLPADDWHSSGLMIRSATDGNTYAMVNVGRQGPAFGMPRTYGTQAMNKISANSQFHYEASTGSVLSGRIRICRVGSDVALLRELDSDVGGAGWHALQYTAGGDGLPSFPSPGLAGDVNVGIMMSRWSNSADNVQAEFEYVRFAEPTDMNDCLVDDISTLGGGGGPLVTTTPSPVTPLPTPAPVTASPVTASPVTNSPVTPSPVTSSPVTPSPVTPSPITSTPVTASPVTSSPATPSPATPSPVTPSPATSSPVDGIVSVESLSDEFFDSSTFADWTDVDTARYTSASVSDGLLTVVPSGPQLQNVWYDSYHGAGFTKAVPAGTNFVVETLVNVRVGTDGMPDGDWHVGGIVVRSATQLNDWVCANLGLQGANPQRMGIPQSLAVETKTTDDGVSHFNYSPDLRSELTPPTGSTLSARLRICRVGTEFLFLYAPPTSAQSWWSGGWTVQNPLPSHAPWNGVDGVPTVRPDLGGELNVGVMTNHMMGGTGGPDPFTVRFDYVRFGTVNALGECTGAMSVM